MSTKRRRRRGRVTRTRGQYWRRNRVIGEKQKIIESTNNKTLELEQNKQAEEGNDEGKRARE